MKENCQTIIILHGWNSSKEKWERVKKKIEKAGMQVFIPDLPGFKKKLNRPWSLDDYLEWFKEFSENKGKFFLLGHSFGGRISIKFATQYPEKIKGLILVGAAGIKHKKGIKGQIILKITKFFKKTLNFPVLRSFYPFLRIILYKYILRKTDYLKAKGAMKQTFLNIIEEDLTPYLSQIKSNTLIIWGRNDKTTPFFDGKLMKENIKDSKLEILETGHAPYLESSEILSRKIIDFIYD